jgi:heat shock protein HspQ
MEHQEAKFHVGQLITHLKAGYRGAIYDIDPVFSETEEWYAAMAKSLPPKDEPWYHVLVDGQRHTTYVAERHLASDETGDPIVHPLVDHMFSGFEGGRYFHQIAHN